MKLFELFATLTLDTSSFNTEVKNATAEGKALGDEMTAAVTKGTVLGNTLTGLFKGAVNASKSVFTFGRNLVETAADVQAEAAAYQATFGDLEGEASEAIGRVSEETNILDKRLQLLATQSFSQFKGAGMESALAMDTMERYMGYAADAAAYYNISLSDADVRLRSFLRGNTEAGDMIGLFTSELQRNQKAMELYSLEWQDLNEAQRQLVMLNIIDDIYKQNNVIGQAARESDTYQVVLGNLQERLRQIKATLGAPILEHLTPVLNKFADWLEDNPEIVEGIAATIGDIAEVTFTSLQSILEYMANNGPAIAQTFQSIAGAISSIAENLSGGLMGLLFGRSQNLTIPEAEKQFAEESEKGGIWWNPIQLPSDDDGEGWNAGGLEYVPYNNFRTRLHRGEKVLTAAEAAEYRAGGRGSEIDYPRLASAIAAAMTGVTVQMDGRTVGALVTPTVSERIAKATKMRR